MNYLFSPNFHDFVHDSGYVDSLESFGRFFGGFLEAVADDGDDHKDVAEAEDYPNQLADLVHTQTARHHLTQGTRPLEEVAYLSGYSDAASLTRAYKRRYGGLPKRPRSASG